MTSSLMGYGTPSGTISSYFGQVSRLRISNIHLTEQLEVWSSS